MTVPRPHEDPRFFRAPYFGGLVMEDPRYAASVSFNHKDTEVYCAPCADNIAALDISYTECDGHGSCMDHLDSDGDVSCIIVEEMHGEVDYPAHCEACGWLLKFRLSDEGIEYVNDALVEARVIETRTPVTDWWAFAFMGYINKSIFDLYCGIGTTKEWYWVSMANEPDRERVGWEGWKKSQWLVELF